MLATSECAPGKDGDRDAFLGGKEEGLSSQSMCTIFCAANGVRTAEETASLTLY